MNQTKKIILSKQQKEIMQLFYAVAPTEIVIPKKTYSGVWKTIKKGKELSTQENLQLAACPAIICKIQKSDKSNRKRLIQSGTFSECVYAQTLANILGLSNFADYERDSTIGENALVLLKQHDLEPQYIYTNEEKSKLLIQAGSCKGVDAALIINNEVIYCIEFKEPNAQSVNPDLPKYEEDGNLVISQEFLKEFSCYEDMLNEQKDLNFFDTMGHNINDFSKSAIVNAINSAYNTTKHADVIVTADKNRFLTMLPADQIEQFASHLEGEIRGSGRNPSEVWTPQKLKRYINELGGSIIGDRVSIKKGKLKPRKERGGTKISGYKINPLFFVRKKDAPNKNDTVSFLLDKVKQLKPCIAAKMNFAELKHEKVKEYYKEYLQ